jgi:hypothetical protein
MNRILVFLLIVCSSAFGQDLKIIKSTKQTINGGASPTSTTNYVVQFKKESSFKWSVDSVVNANTQKSIQYTILKVDNPDLSSPNFQSVKCFSKKDKGLYQINFASSKNRGGGRPNSPTGVMVELPDFPKGAIIYYRVGKKRKQLIVETFEELETINAP